LHSIGADEKADVYGTLLPQPAVAPHALGTGRWGLRRGVNIGHRFVSRLLSAGSRLSLSFDLTLPVIDG
jgi:hypothetical protein